MRARRRWARRHLSVALLLAALVVVFVMLGSGSVLASPPWPDAPNAWWVSTYGVTEGQAATVADGRADGKFYPNDDITRAQFAKMAVDGTGGTTYTPLTPSFLDVPATNYFYPWIEGGVRDGLISGYGNQTFGPNNNIIRQQANSILGVYLAQKELNLRGHIAGEQDNYPSLNTWYMAEGMTLLGGFADAARLATVHAPTTAYLISKGVVQGTAGTGGMYLGPNNNLTRAQAVALILRVSAVTFPTALPTVTGLNPAGGPTAGGNTVIVTGTNFTGATAVKFGTTDATAFTVNSGTQITAIAPVHVAGTVDVTVTTPAGTSSAAGVGNDYTYGPPAVTGLNPAGGPTAGGNTVTITGTNFTGATAVKFGNVNAKSYVVNSATQITAVAPAHVAGTVDVTVTTPIGTSSATGAGNDYTYGNLPTVTGLNPNHGPVTGGNTVTITGTNFTGATAVKFGTTSATAFTVNSATRITATAPAHVAGVVDVTVTTPVGTSSATGAGNDYTYGNLPTVTGLSPVGGPTTGGNTVTITGTNFTGATAVRFGTTSATAFTVNSATRITAVAPAHVAGVVDVTVTTPIGTSSAAGVANDYLYGGYPLGVTGIDDPVAAGTPSTVTVRVLDASDAVVTTYTGTIRFSSNDPAADLPSDYTFTSANAGVQTFTNGVTLYAAGSRTVTVTDMAAPAINGSQTVTVQALAADYLNIEDAADGSGAAVGAVSVGSGSTLTVYSVTRDMYDNYVGNPASTWSLSDKTGGVVDGDLAAADGGKSAVFTGGGLGTAVIHATADGLAGDTGTVTVTAGVATKYNVTADKSSVVAGSTVTISAQLADAGNNPVSTAGIVVTWSKSDANGSFAAATSTTDANGVATVEFTTHTVGGTETTVTATTGAVTGTSATISTTTPPALQYIATASGGSVGASSVSATIPTTAQNGDLLVAVVCSYSGSATETPSGPTDWTLLASQSGETTNFSVWYKVRAADSGSVTWTFETSRQVGLNIAVYRGGFNAADPIDVFSNTPYTANDTNLRAASVTTTAANEYLLFVASAWLDDTNRTTTPPPDFTEDVDNHPYSPFMLRYFAHSNTYQATPGATGDINAAMSSALADTKHAFLIALKPYLD